MEQAVAQISFYFRLRVMMSFLQYRGSQPGHFKALRTGDASPSTVPLDFGPAGHAFARGQGVPHSVTP